MKCPFRLGVILASITCLWISTTHAITLHVTDDQSVQIDRSASSHNRHKPWKSRFRDYYANRLDNDTISIQRLGRHQEQQGFVKFDLSPLTPQGQIERATLRLWLHKVQKPGILHLHEVLADWDERTIRGRQMPPTTPAFDTLTIKKADKNQFITIDITAIVQGWTNSPDTNFGLAFVSDHSNPVSIALDSKENHHTSHPMEIEVTLLSGAGNDGPPGPQGPSGIPGPPGQQGPPGITPVLIMIGQNCPTGEFLTGFDSVGNILCEAPPISTEPPGPTTINDVDPGEVIITEIMINPSAVTDGNGEWFELFNTRQETVDIQGWTIQEESGNAHVIPNTDPILIPAGQFLILGNNSNASSNGGVFVAHEYTSITLNNGGDTLSIFDVTGEEIDHVKYETPSFSIPTGASLNLNANHFNGLENNDGANWCASTTAIGANLDLGTPGVANDPC